MGTRKAVASIRYLLSPVTPKCPKQSVLTLRGEPTRLLSKLRLRNEFKCINVIDAHRCINLPRESQVLLHSMQFPTTQKIFLSECQTGFVKNWLTPHTFPNLTHIYSRGNIRMPAHLNHLNYGRIFPKVRFFQEGVDLWPGQFKLSLLSAKYPSVKDLPKPKNPIGFTDQELAKLIGQENLSRYAAFNLGQTCGVGKNYESLNYPVDVVNFLHHYDQKAQLK